VAALIIAVEAIPRLLHPQPLEQVGLGLSFSVLGALINGVLAWFMLRAGKRLRSIALQADARHLFADVWTTVGVLVGVALVALTGWLRLDPIIALLVAANIIWIGIRLLHQTGLGLLDTVLPKEDLEQIEAILASIEHKVWCFMPCAHGKLALVVSSPFMCLSPVPGLWRKDIAYAKQSSLPFEANYQRQPCLPTWNHVKIRFLLRIRRSTALPWLMNRRERHKNLLLLPRLFLTS
jgi:Cation efflux family